MGHSVPHDPLERINTHHVDELEVIARAFGGVLDLRAVRALRVDVEGLDIAMESPDGTIRARIRFDDPVSGDPSGIRVAFVRLARRARRALVERDTSRGAAP